MPKRRWQPNKRKRNRTHGFLVRSRSTTAYKVMKKRRAKGRKRLAPSSYKKSK